MYCGCGLAVVLLDVECVAAHSGAAGHIGDVSCKHFNGVARRIGIRIRVGSCAAGRVKPDVVDTPCGIVGILGCIVAEADINSTRIACKADIARGNESGISARRSGCKRRVQLGFGGGSHIGRRKHIYLEYRGSGTVAVHLAVECEHLVIDLAHVDGRGKEPLVEGRLGALEAGHGSIVVVIE